MTAHDLPRKPSIASRTMLAVARLVPRGSWRIVKFTADRDPALWDYLIPLRVPLGEAIRVDMRETVSMNFFRCGLIPGQRGHEAVLRRLLRDGDTCFDVGANVGYTAILFASIVGASGRVVALEPGDRAFASLANNAAGRSNVIAKKLGASNKAGTVTFYESVMSDVSSIVPVTNAKKITIQTTSLDDLAREYGNPQFVKIDVEGHEPAVLDGMSQILQSAHPPIVLFEALSDEVLTECLQLFARLGEGYEVRSIGKDGALSSRLSLRETADFLALPPWASTRTN